MKEIPTLMPSVLKKIFKIFAWILGSLIALLVIAALLVQIPAVQRRLTARVIASLEDKLGTPVSLEGIRIGFPKSIVLEGLYFEDQHGDTLLYAGKLSVNTDLWALTRREIQLNQITLERTSAFVHRAENDSAFNFTYILKAFAGDSTAVPDTLEQKGWNFTVKDIELRDIRARYDDLLAGNHLALGLGTLELGMKTVDLEKSIYQAKDLELAETTISFRQTKPPVASDQVEEEEDSAASVALTLEKLNIRNTHVSYEQVPLGQYAEMGVGDLEVRAKKVDLINHVIDLERIAMSNTSLHYQVSPSKYVSDPPDEVAAEESDNGWSVSLDELAMTNNDIQYYDLTQPHRKGAVDFHHLWLTELRIAAQDIKARGETVQARIENVSFREESGFSLKSFTGNINIADNAAALEDFSVVTGNSQLRMSATARYNSLDDIATSYTRAQVSADISDSFISVRDILYFDPSFRDSIPLQLPSQMQVHLDASVRGTVDNLEIRQLALRSLSDTGLDLRGNITGLPEMSNLGLNVTVNKLHTTGSDVATVLPPGSLPDSIQLPKWIDLVATYKGSLDKGSLKSELTSDAGRIVAEGRMNIDSASSLRGVEATLRVIDLALGRTLGKTDSVMGNLSMEARLHSRGLTPKEMDAAFTASIMHFSYGGYDYRDLTLHGTVRDTTLSATASMSDENLEFTLQGGYTFTQTPRYQVTLDLKNVDLQALRLANQPLRARGELMVDLETSDFRVLNGNVGVRKVAIFNGDELYAIDSLLFASIDQEGHSEINIDSDLLEARFEGTINLFALPGVMRQYVHTYYSLNDSLEVTNPEPQRFDFNVRIKNTAILTGLLIPELTRLVPGEIRGTFDSEARQLDFRMAIDEAQYANVAIDSLVLSASSDEDALRYALAANRILIDSMRVDGLVFDGKVASDSIRTHLVILDSADNSKYVLAGTLFSEERGFQFQLLPDSILLNYQPWQVPADNYLRMEGGQFVAHHVALTNRREKITIESGGAPPEPVTVGFRELNLEYLSSMIAEEEPLSGLVNGDIRFFRTTDGPAFTSDIRIDDFHLRRVPWGDVTVQVEQKGDGKLDVNASLSGKENNVMLRGSYAGDALDLDGRINRFQLASLQPLLAAQVSDLAGVVSGSIGVRGTTDKPDINGNLRFQNTKFRSLFLNSGYTIDDESIAFVNEGISFRNFDITDRDGNDARVNGMIRTVDYRDFAFDLRLNTEKFRLLNTTEDDNDLFYGKVNVDAIARITGTMTTPVINLQVGLGDGSHLTYVVPQSEASVLQSDGIVRFVDKTFEGDPFMRKIANEAADTVKSTFLGIDLTARVELTDKDDFTIVIDPVTKDQLSIRGNSTMTLKIDPSGDIQLAGRYEISEGTYNLSFYKFVKREFSIEKGSAITWSGDPMNADMDIRALYAVETSPIELFSNQLTGADATQVNLYRQRLPFQVFLQITGELLQPEIGFSLGMPQGERNAIGGSVYARLQDINTRESDLNKQVFALLILKRFIADDPFENQAGGGLESTARRSVSKVLTEQLNRLSENIKGVELSFDIKSYEEYSSGQGQGQTELQLGVSKSLFNDRLVVKLSGNIDIEGEDARREATDYIGDLALEYKVTPDGRFRITGFRNSNYDMIDGELTETGAGLIYVKDYNTLSELFKANAQN